MVLVWLGLEAEVDEEEDEEDEEEELMWRRNLSVPWWALPVLGFESGGKQK